MLFNSLAFAVFAVAFFLAYFSVTGRIRLSLIVAASYFFYAWWDWRFVSLLVVSTLVDFYIAKRISSSNNERSRKALVTLSLCSNLGMLATFKYFDFFSVSFRELFHTIGWDISTPVLNVILPVGISFYTFQTLSYTIDVYRRRIEADSSLLRFAAYVALFPQLVAGPIVRAADLLPQLRIDQKLDYANIGKGVELVIWGFFLKLCLADTAGLLVDPAFDNPSITRALPHLIAVVSFSFQIYGDFAGYSLIAIGLGRIMGFDFGINFNRPYFSTSFSEFWTRWHISLSSWLRDYLYISLGGNRGGKLRTFRNLMLTMLLGGLWHGAGWTFIVWGGLHGGYLVLQRILSPWFWRAAKAFKIPRILSMAFLMILIFALTNLAWIFFRAERLEDAIEIIRKLSDFQSYSLTLPGQKIVLLKAIAIVLIVLAVDSFSMNKRIRALYQNQVWMRISGAISILWLILLLGTFDGASFIYFQF